MAVAHSSASESHTGTTGSVGQTAFSWTHTQTGTPQGVLVFVHVANSSSNPVSSVTYGTVTLTRVEGGAAVDSAGEAGRTDLFFAGSGLASGNQTITVNRANTTDIMYASAATVTALTDTNVTGIVLLEGDGALTVQSVTDGGAPTNSLRYAAAYSGLASPPPAGTGSTLLNSIDYGSYGIALVRETTAGTGARNVGFNNATTDDRAAVHVAVRELWNRTDTETVGAFTLTGQPADLRHNPDIEAGVGAFTLTGQPATTRHNVRIDGGTGAFSLTGNDATLSKAGVAKEITAERGQFTLNGNAASTLVAVQLGGDVGKFFLPERNIARWSEQFENNYWNKIGVGSALAPAVSTNHAVAPDGTTTADQVVFDTNGSATTNDRSGLEASTLVVTGRTYIFSVWLKTTDGSTITLQLSHANASPNYVVVTPTWQRFSSLSNTASDAIRYARLALRVGTPTSAYASLHVWGFQWEESASVTDYDPTGPAGATDTSLRQQYKLTTEVGTFAFTGNPATLAKGRTITTETGTFTTTGQPATLRHNPRIEANTGSFALNGGAPALLRGRYLSGGSGTFTETGQPATFRRTWAIQGGTGTFVLTGQQVITAAGATITGDTGKFFLPERNLRQWSEELNNAYWTKNNSSITANSTTAPDGTLTADTLIENTTSTTHVIVRNTSFTAGVKYTASLYVKTYQNRDVALLLGTTAAFGGASNTLVVFSPSTNTFLQVLNSPEAYGSEDVGNGWYRIYITKTAVTTATTSSQIQLRIGTTGTYTGDGSSGAYIWGVQLEVGDLSSYDPTDANSATDAAFRRGFAIQGGTGAFALTGNPASLTELGTYGIDPLVGAFTLSGQPANLAQTQTMPVDAGTFALTGQAATLRQNRAAAAETGLFAATGQPASLTQGHLLNAGTGAFSFTGNPATLAKQSAKQLAADAGNFTLSGQSAELAQGYRLGAEAAIYALTPNPAALNRFRIAAAETGNFSFAGVPATFTAARLLPVTPGAFNLAGQAAAFTLAGSPILTADTGIFALTGNPVSFGLIDVYALEPATGTFALTGSPATFTYEQRRRVILIF